MQHQLASLECNVYGSECWVSYGFLFYISPLNPTTVVVAFHRQEACTRCSLHGPLRGVGKSSSRHSGDDSTATSLWLPERRALMFFGASSQCFRSNGTFKANCSVHIQFRIEIHQTPTYSLPNPQSASLLPLAFISTSCFSHPTNFAQVSRALGSVRTSGRFFKGDVVQTRTCKIKNASARTPQRQTKHKDPDDLGWHE